MLTRTVIFALFLVLLAGCASKDVLVLEVAPPTPEVPTLPGVDSVFTAMAEAYANRGMLITPSAASEARIAVDGGRRLLAIADSLIQAYTSAQDTVLVPDADKAASIEQFNQGAQVLQSQSLGQAELDQAAQMFQSALDLNPYDEEALYWLSRVYELQAQKFMDAGANEDMLEVVKTLVELNPLRHDYAAILANAYESLGDVTSWADAGAWWHRASVLSRDAPALALTDTDPDTSTIFIYLANASRAFAEANDGGLSLGAIDEATPFARTDEEVAYLSSEREWLSWDASIKLRKQFDHLITLSVEDPDSAAIELRTLLSQVTTLHAEVDVQHQLALALFNAGQATQGLIEVQQVWSAVQRLDTTRVNRIREDYGTMSYTMAMEHRNNGELRNAIAYLLQSEATGFSGAALSSLTRSILLRTDPEASLDAAEMAYAGWDQLDGQSQRTLVEHLVWLHRRMNNRDEAARYAAMFRTLSGG